MLKLVLLATVVAYASLALLAQLIADRLMFLPPRSSYGGELPVKMVPTADGAEIAVLHLPNPQAEFTILYSHGNAEDLGHLRPLLERLRDSGFTVLAFDYRGYGRSTGGPPTSRGATRDLWAVYDFAVDELGVPPERLILLGRSLGSGPATELAARASIGGLVLESAFVSAFRVITRVPLLPFDRFTNLAHLSDVVAPVLVIHGTDDTVIPFWHGRRLYDAASTPKQAFWVEGAGHNDLVWRAGDRYFAALQEFTRMIDNSRSRSGARAQRPEGLVSRPPPASDRARSGDRGDAG